MTYFFLSKGEIMKLPNKQKLVDLISGIFSLEMLNDILNVEKNNPANNVKWKIYG